jgi:hypothetical protein
MIAMKRIAPGAIMVAILSRYIVSSQVIPIKFWQLKRPIATIASGDGKVIAHNAALRKSIL